MRAYATFRTSDGSRFELVHGDMIGRLWCAALPLDDGRISEAHAMVSLRTQELRLIALRGAFAVEGRPVSEVALRPGLEIVLARGLSLEVESVFLPSFVLGIEGPHFPRQVLPSVCSILIEPELRLVSQYVDGAASWIWCTGESWRLRTPQGITRPLTWGDTVQAGSHSLDIVQVPLAKAGGEVTRHDGGVLTPLRIHANFDTVHIHQGGQVAVVLGGVAARIVSELAALGGPAHWTVLAGLLWPQEADPEDARSRLDVNMSRLRRKLKDGHVRTDLVHTDGAGQIELLLYPHDTLEDRT